MDVFANGLIEELWTDLLLRLENDCETLAIGGLLKTCPCLQIGTFLHFHLVEQIVSFDRLR